MLDFEFYQIINSSYNYYQIMQAIKRFILSHLFFFTYLPAIVGVASAGLFFEQAYFIQKTWERYYLLTTSNYGLYILCFISFYQCIRIKNTLPPYLPQPRIKSQLRHNHPLYTQIHTCDKQNQKYKPPRTSHCHLDGCIARFDHHCPFINNCVGMSNFKAFILFSGYGGLFALQFLTLSIYKYYVMMQTGVNTLSEGEISSWMFLTAAAFMLTLSMLGLAVSNLITLTKNITKIDLMKGTFMFTDKQGLHPNPFDLGTFTNFANIFEGQLWTFWWPSALVARYDGVRYPMVPPISDADKKSLFANVQQMLKDPIERSMPKTIQQLYEREKQNYKNTIFFYLGEQYTLDDLPQKNIEKKVYEEVIHHEQPLKQEQKDNNESQATEVI